MEISGKIIVLTGASQGIGAAAAKALAAKGGKLVLLARGEEKLKLVAEEIKNTGGEAHIFAVDLSNPEALKTVTQEITEQLGTPNILINNAGAGRWLYVEDTSPEENQMMMAVPYFAAFNLCHYFIPGMLKRRSGLIINLNSPASRVSWAGSAGYACSRWALRGLTACLRNDLYNTGVKVAEVMPGEVNSEYFDNNPGVRERLPRFLKYIRPLETSEVADMLIRCIEKDKAEVIHPFVYRLANVLQRLFPSLTRWFMIQTGVKR